MVKCERPYTFSVCNILQIQNLFAETDFFNTEPLTE